MPTEMRSITAVTFDLWDTLIQEVPGNSDKVACVRVDGIRRFLEEKGLVHSVEEVMDAYAKTGEFLNLLWSKNRDMPVRDQVLFLLTSIDSRLTSKLSPPDISAIENIYCRGIFAHPPVLLPGAKELLEAVRSRGLRTALISNTGRTPGSTLRALLESMGILRHFDVTTFSNEILVRKPSEAAFTVTLDRLRVVPIAAVHVGDDALRDVFGARSAGMHAIHLVRNGEAPSELADAHASSLAEVLERLDEL